MKTATAAYWLCTCVLIASLGRDAVLAGDVTRIDAVLKEAVARGDVPGVVAMAANSQGVIYQGAFGKRNVGQDEDMTVDTVFRIASMTKAVTSVAAMQLVEEGVLTLDTAVANHLPALADLQVLEAVDREGKQMQLRCCEKPVTVRQLLTHTAGFGYNFLNALLHEATEAGCFPSILDKEDGFLDLPLVCDPGERWEYGISTDWLGRLVESARKITLDQVLEQHVLNPLRMTDTHFNLPAEKLPRLVTLHQRQADESLVETAREAPATVTFFSGGGGLCSTAPDYIRFLRALLRRGELDGSRILQPETVRLMGQNHIGELEAGRMKTAIPSFSNDFDFRPESVDRFGLGFLINGAPVAGGREAGSLAWAGIFNTYFWLDPQQDVCGVLMTQVLPFYDAKIIRLLEDFERAVYACPSR